MTIHRSALCVASLAAVSVLAMSACSSTVIDAGSSSSGESPTPPAGSTTATSDTTDTPTPATTVDVPAEVVGPGCADYVQKVPSGPGSLPGMAVDPVGVALSNSPQLTTLAGALSGKLNADVNLYDSLNKGQFTVFAPTDAAFARLDPAVIEKFKTDSVELTSVLNYHVVSGDLAPSAVVGEHKTLQGQSVTVSRSGDDLRVNNAGVVCGGIKTANATVYLVDTVLMPPAPAPPTTSGTPPSGTAPTSVAPTAAVTPSS